MFVISSPVNILQVTVLSVVSLKVAKQSLILVE